jgi:hypothetical protein
MRRSAFGIARPSQPIWAPLSQAFALCFALLSATGCKSTPAAEGAACKAKADCAEGLSCVDNVCTTISGDASAADPASGYCETIAALAGTWTFDTTVIGAEDLAPRGINGHYTMTVTADHCTANVALTKTGYDEVVYSDKKIQKSEAALSESTQIPHAATATFSLKGKPTHTMTFTVRDGQLFGSWQSAGAEWKRAGMWGFLRGVADGQDLAKVEDFAAQPCEVRCLTQCDEPRGRADGVLDEGGLAACMTACSADEPIVGCGPGKDLPEELVVPVHGPAASFDELCAKASAELIAQTDTSVPVTAVTCDRKPPVAGKPATRTLSKAALAGSFKSAELIQLTLVDDATYEQIHLVLETEAGWFWTDALLDLSVSGVGGISAETTSLVLRARELLSAPGREVVAELAMRMTDSDTGINEVSVDESKYAVVCSTGSPPQCLRLALGWSSKRTLIDDSVDNDPKDHPDLASERGELYLAFLPGDLVSISAPAEARATDLSLRGLYRWAR